MATQVEESPLEAREDRLRRRAARKSSKADRLEAKGKTKRAAKKRGAAGVKTAKADKIAGKQDAKDAKQAGRQAKKLSKVKGKVDKKAEKKENRSTKRDERKENRGKKIKKAKADVTAAGKKAAGAVKDKAKATADKAKGAAKKVKGAAKKVKAGVEKGKRKMKAAVGAFKGTNMEGPSMGDSNRLQGAGSEGAPGLGRMSMGRGSNKYDNANNIGGPSMSGEKYDMKEAYNSNMSKSARFNYLKNAMHDNKGKGGSSLSKHFGRNRSKKRQIDR